MSMQHAAIFSRHSGLRGFSSAQDKTVQGYEAAKEQVKASPAETSEGGPTLLERMKQGAATAPLGGWVQVSLSVFLLC